MAPKLSIIIPTFNTCELTKNCLAHIFETPTHDLLEVIVIDNNSEDGTFQAIKTSFPQVVAIENTVNKGFSKACNQAAQQAKGEYLLFLNGDTEPSLQTFQELIQWLDTHKQTGIVGPELIGPHTRILQMSWSWNPLFFGELMQQYFAPYAVKHSPWRQKLIRYLQRKSRTVPSMCGACLMIRRTVFDQIGGFDEGFELYFEDSDLCWRCRKAGWEIDFVAEAKIVHHLGQSTRGSWSLTSLIYQQSHLTYYRKHSTPFGVNLLKTYLWIKWLRLNQITRWVGNERDQAQQYCRAYRNIISERSRVKLAEGLPR